MVGERSGRALRLICNQCQGTVFLQDPDGARCYGCGAIVYFDEHGKPYDPMLRMKKEQQEAIMAEVVSKPAEWARLNNWKRYEWFERHKEQIITDAKAAGSRATRRRWGIKKSTFRGLMARWEVVLPPEDPDDEPDQETDFGWLPSQMSMPALPELPKFNDTWPPEVQLRWLGVYEVQINAYIKAGGDNTGAPAPGGVT